MILHNSPSNLMKRIDSYNMIQKVLFILGCFTLIVFLFTRDYSLYQLFFELELYDEDQIIWLIVSVISFFAIRVFRNKIQ